MGCDLNNGRYTPIMQGFNPRTRMGCDPVRSDLSVPLSSFNPRTRMGCDNKWRAPGGGIIVSIRAPAWGAIKTCPIFISRTMFQSAHPHGVRWQAHKPLTINVLNLHFCEEQIFKFKKEETFAKIILIIYKSKCAIHLCILPYFRFAIKQSVLQKYQKTLFSRKTLPVFSNCFPKNKNVYCPIPYR